MADVPILELDETGQELPTPLAATGDDTIRNNDGNLVIEISNPTGSALVCSFIAARTFAGMTFPPRNITVEAGDTVWTRPLPPAVFNDTRRDVAVEADVGLLLRGLRF